MPHLTVTQWLLALVAATGVGISKSGLSGMSLLHVLIFAFLFGARESTGVVLPMLLFGDIFAVRTFHQHARWDYVRRMLPPACIGVAVAAWFMRGLSEAVYKPIIGGIILALTVLQLARLSRPQWFGSVPHARWFAWSLGLLAGAATMLANAAGPVFAIYCLAVALPKLELVGTSAWFFLIVNAFKVPFSIALGLIHGQTLLLNLLLTPMIGVGMLFGRWITRRIPQRLFDGLLLTFAAVAALRLIGLF
ncbi:MAG: sulfite exporter TauE/SafE family protein [Acidobacteriota bacterium]